MQSSRLLLALAALSATSIASAQRIAAEAPEPNNTLFGPSAYGCGFQGNGEISVAGDEDWWTFTVGADSDIVLYTGLGRGATITDTILDLLDHTGAVVATNDDARGLYSVIETTLTPGIYYANVRGFSTRVGTYSLDLSCAPAAGPAMPLNPLEAPEPNGNPDPTVTAPNPNLNVPTAAACDTAFDGVIDSGTDTDWYVFTLAAPTDININTDAGSAGSEVVDTIIELFDASFASVAVDDDGGLGLYSQIVQTALPAGTYYVEVDGFGTSRVGNYSIEFDCDGTPDRILPSFVLADWIDNGNGCGAATIAPRGLEWPLVGTTFCVDISGMQPGAGGLTALGYNASVTPTGAPLPLDLAAIGAPGCVLYVEPFDLQLMFADLNGDASWCVFIPNNAAFLGFQFYQQAAEFDPAANAAGLSVSNWGEGVVGDRL